MMQPIRKATSDDADVLINHLVRAFDDDPVANYLVRQDHGRLCRLNRFFRICLCKLSLRHNEVYTTGDRSGGALWYPPGTLDIGLVEGLLLFPDLIGVVGLRGIGRMMTVFAALDDAHPREKHYYLQIIGVDPDRQGRGLGTALMQPVLERCDREGCGAYLENSKEANTPFYNRNGFVVTGRVELGTGAPPVWPMWRDPQ